MRIAVLVEYDGSQFCGWQIQRGVRTVQQQLEYALSSVADEPIRVICAGRTDTGVHATGQYVHFETQASRTMRSWVLGGNANMPHDVSLLSATQVSSEFHARFSARSRHYRYVILNRGIRSSLFRNKVSWIYHPLNETLMHEAACALIGEHDFTSFRALACQAKSPVRTIHSIRVHRQSEFVYIDVHANAFLHHMVRNIAGVLIAIGSAERPVSWCHELLECKDRTQGGVTAPPHGLYLVQVEYDPKFNVPIAVSRPVFA